MRFQPFERWVTLQEAPDLHQDASAIIKPVSFSRRDSAPNTGRWFRVVESAEGLPPYFGPGAPVMCNLSSMSDRLEVGGVRVDLMPFSQCAALRIGDETMKQLGVKHPVLPIGDYLLLRDNDAKHRRILGLKDGVLDFAPLSTLERGQRTDEQYETAVDQHGWETPRANRENDGVRMMFSEVVGIGPEVPAGRVENGDMVAFRANCCGIRFDLYGVSYRLVRCSERNSEVVGRVPAAEFLTTG